MINAIKIEDLDGNIISKEDIKKDMEVIITWENGRKCIYQAKKDYDPNDTDWRKILGKQIILS
jgi:hypothetical protein